MELNKYDQLSKLDMSTYDWECRVRAQAVWKAMNRETQEFWGLNIIFIDDSNSRIHAYANAKYCGDIEKDLVEGRVYLLSNFKVKDFLGDETYRPVRNKKHIFFTKDTKLKEGKAEGLKIEKYAFDLFHMMEIEKLANDNRFLVDMVGFMKNRGPIITTNKNNQDKHRLKLELVDGRHGVPVTFFDEFALALDKVLPLNDDEDVILIICCAKVNRYDGKAHLSNYPATRVYINPDHYSADNLRKSLEALKTLSEEYIEKQVCCEVLVKKIETEQKWYLTNCINEVQLEGDKFKCHYCKRIIPHPRRRFQIQTLYSDNTASVSIVFPDSEVSRILQKTVEDLYSPDQEELREKVFPTELKQFENHKYNITIQLKEDNIVKGSCIYEAIEIGETIESSGNFTPKHQSIQEEVLSDMKGMETEDLTKETPQTERSINTKTRSRKNQQPIPFDADNDIGARRKVDKVIEHKFNFINLKEGNFDWKLKVRIIRLWRGVTKSGEVFKGFNIILLDDNNNRIHAFVPGSCSDKLEEKLQVGKICLIRKFEVQKYKADIKFRCLRNDVQLVFSTETQVKEIQDDDKSIEANVFDFYDHSELKALTTQKTYLADVVGIIKHYEPLTNLVNRLGDPQKQVKMIITYGRSSVNVTFWDTFAENFDKEMNEVVEKPVILIIASSRVGLWNEEVDLSSVGATQFYLNYNHYSVLQLRKRLTQVGFTDQIYAKDKHSTVELLKVAAIQNLGKEYIEREVFAHLNIHSMEETEKWYSTICTACEQELKIDEGNYYCRNCDRILPHPDKKFNISVIVGDDTGDIQVRLGDQQIRTVVGNRAVHILKEVGQATTFPTTLQKLEKQNFTVKLIIKEVNVVNNVPIYKATNICKGFIDPNEKKEETNTSSQQNTAQTSSSSYHLDGMSQLNFQSPMSTTKMKEH
ncbi:hypothetical protein POM88_025966 [Heracleum sosnowskyi]|uniref:Uncharacterized protein n=1 Tax=Heracleum sosnowskyi TaxID=360622 RepID=A0AAD8I4W7_9APIA|nr:hypothetical protein POM88_025966 [Heracleum sosnowskyi]